MKQKGLFYVAITLLGLLVVLAIFAPWIAPYSPTAGNVAAKIQAPSAMHWLGTDYLGRDVLSRLLYGARISLLLAVSICVLTVCIGAPIGLFVGWYGGRVDTSFTWLMNVILAFPTFLLALALAGVFGQGMGNLILAVTLVGWINYARLLRNLVHTVKGKEYIINARLMGAGPVYVIRKHVLPFVYQPVLVLILLDLGHLILMISGFSFLGIGVQPNVPEWGMMINDARPYFRSMPSLILYPGFAIFITVVCFNIVGEFIEKMGGKTTWK